LNVPYVSCSFSVAFLAVSKSRKETTDDRKVLGGCTECFVSGDGINRRALLRMRGVFSVRKELKFCIRFSINIIMQGFK
jgi:hypothetical protein